MDHFTAFAQSTGGGASSSWMQLLPILLMVVIFYFLLIRPSQRKEKDRKKMIDALQKGEKVLTVGGIYGVVSAVKKEEGVVTLKIAENTKVDFAVSSIQAKVS